MHFGILQFAIFCCIFSVFIIQINAGKDENGNDNGEVKNEQTEIGTEDAKNIELLDETENRPGRIKRILFRNSPKKEQARVNHIKKTNEHTMEIKDLEQNGKKLGGELDALGNRVDVDGISNFAKTSKLKTRTKELEKKQQTDHIETNIRIDEAIEEGRENKKELKENLKVTNDEIGKLNNSYEGFKTQTGMEHKKLWENLGKQKDEQQNTNLKHEARMREMSSGMETFKQNVGTEFGKRDEELAKHGKNQQALKEEVSGIVNNLSGTQTQLDILQGNSEVFQKKTESDIRKNSAEIKTRGKELDDKISANRKGIEEGAAKQNALESNIGELRGHVNRGFEEQTNLVNAHRKEGEERLKARGDELEGKIAGIQKNQEMHIQQYQTDQEENAKRHGKHEAERGELKERTERNEAGILATNDELGKVKLGIEEQNGENRRSFEGLTAKIGEQSQGLAGNRADLLGLEGKFNGHVEKDFNGLKGELEGQSNRLGEIENTARTHGGHIHELQSTLGGVKSEVEKLGTVQTGLANKVTEWDQKHSGLKAQYRGTEEEFRKHKEAWAAHQTETAKKRSEFQKELGELKEEFGLKKTKLTEVEAKLLLHEGKLEKLLTGQMHELEQKVEGMDKEMEREKQANAREMAELKAEMANLPKFTMELQNVGKEMNKMENLGNKINGQEKEMGELKETVQGLEKHIKHSEHSIGNQMAKMEDKLANQSQNILTMKESLKNVEKEIGAGKLNAHNRREYAMGNEQVEREIKTEQKVENNNVAEQLRLKNEENIS